MLIKILALAAFAPLMILAACSGDDDNATTTPKPAASGATATAAGGGAPQDLTITAADFSLSPATITASAGTKINLTFKNTGSAEHSFTVGSTDVTEADGGATTNGTYTVKTGDTEFHCKYHPTTMKGTITVSGSSSSNGLGTNPASATSSSGGISGGIGY